MKLKHILLSSLFVAVAALGAARPGAHEGLVVHEWGTFLSMNGSDGITLDGMYHEEHALPDFVHARSKDQLRIRSSDIKGETPVIYFYTDHPLDASVRVRFPRGVWTQWYPQAEKVVPNLTQLGGHLEPRNGLIAWQVSLLPAGEKDAIPLPKTASDALWNYARDVDAAYVKKSYGPDGKGASEYERFLFYRGLGRAVMPLGLSFEQGGTLSLSAENAFGLRHLFVIRVENGKGAYKYLPSLGPGNRITRAIPDMAGAQPLEAFSRKIGDDLAAKLVDSGLYAKEARAMVNTWRLSYFQSDGIRVLYVLPQSWTEKFIPMEISPEPQELVRVMVGRTELLTPEREKRAEGAVRDLAAPEAAVREQAFTYLREQGRYVEPILRRTLQTSQDLQVRALCSRLLLSDFVTELRSAVNAANNGAHLPEGEGTTPLRAQLASLLREVGLTEEAKAEAQSALQDLQRHPAPPIEENQARHYLRAYARAMEGLGDDRKAAEGYGNFIRFASQVKNGCAGCHSGVTAPRDMAWFQDWYAGRKFATYMARTGQADSAVARQEARLADYPDDTCAQMELAYLYTARGRKDKAATLWARMEGPVSKKVATK